ncbi:unconventional myosin-IXa-like [Notothenia coriiceps]|uniref:Unconventional myosin-IXa-like n=1 Tax=Notothenia coriiceps TaxID=8208 RepID=A0A6I9Q3A8_9TELE|nr:PREDICTED: unconventional myosin-IXa-like [Notothenia coriiceps]
MDEHPGGGGGVGSQRQPPQSGSNNGGGGGVMVPHQPDEMPRQQYTIPGILHYIQHEWARFEMERAHWEVERAELQVSIWDVLSQSSGPRERCADGTCYAAMSLQDGGCSYASSANMASVTGSMRRRLEDQEFSLRVYPGALAEGTIYCPVCARKNTTAAEAIDCLIERLRLDRTKCYVLAEVKEFGGEEWILNPSDCPVQRMMLWPRSALENRSGLCSGDDYRFLLREKNLDGSIHYGGSLQLWLRLTEERRRMVERGFLPQPAGTDPPTDLCALPELTERTILESLRAHFRQEKIYTYIGSILIVINPFQFLPIYNPKYVKLYDNHTLGKLEPHIYAVADVAYHAMLQRRKNQCIVISGESGSGKTQSTNFLIHHLTALSQKGFASGVEQIILGAGPVLEMSGGGLRIRPDASQEGAGRNILNGPVQQVREKSGGWSKAVSEDETPRKGCGRAAMFAMVAWRVRDLAQEFWTYFDACFKGFAGNPGRTFHLQHIQDGM